MKTLNFPLIRITLCFVLGILFAVFVNFEALSILILLIIGFSGLIISYLLSLKKNSSFFYFGICSFIISFFLGISTQVIHSGHFEKNHYINFFDKTEKFHNVELILNEKLKNTTYNSRFIANIIGFDQHKASGKIIVNIEKADLNSNLQIGSILQIKGSVYKNREINNPNQFDYGKYLENQQIFAQLYCGYDDIKISSKIDKSIWYYTAKFRDKIISNLEKNNFNGRELNVINALILGQQQDIAPDILKDYQYAGAVHILSVSGLHVGFIMLFIGFLLKPIPNTKMGSTTKLLIVLLSLWSFGFLAGLAPSILRSVVMFSFVAIGHYLRRSINIYHTLLVSAFLILLFKPSFLFDVGFQLSYISLFFIVWLQPLFSSIWKPKPILMKYFWDIITVSFAAQIGAMPISIYYFHQFPGLFFITNLIVLPFTGFILGLGVLVMIMAYFDYVPQFTMQLLEKSIFWLNKIIHWVASFENFIIQNISMNIFMLWSSYLVIISCIIWLKKSNYSKLIFAMISILIFQIICLSTKFYHQNQKELIVFNSNRNTIIAERIGENTTVYGNEKILKNLAKNNLVKPYLIGNFSEIKSKKNLRNLLFFDDKKILIMDSLVIENQDLDPDILILTKSPKLNLDRFLQSCKPKIVVADGSNFKSYTKVWKATCLKRKIPFHATTEKGYYKLK